MTSVTPASEAEGVPDRISEGKQFAAGEGRGWSTALRFPGRAASEIPGQFTVRVILVDCWRVPEVAVTVTVAVMG